MKRLASGHGQLPVAPLAVLSLILLTHNLATAAAPPTATPDDAAAVRATVTDYIDSYYTKDAARMEKSLHPHYLKHTISRVDGELTITEKTGLEMVQELREDHAPPTPLTERKEEITVLDVNGDIASAKLVTRSWTDYLTLLKWNGEWKIVSVVLRKHN